MNKKILNISTPSNGSLLFNFIGGIMNNELQDFARKTLKEGLEKCTDAEQRRFKQMYAGSGWNAGIDINMVVDEMDADRLDWAMKQVRRTLETKGLPSD